jgi:hypothetical protein
MVSLRLPLCPQGLSLWQGQTIFDHCRGWIAERIMEFSAIFSINVSAYAVMSNHYHIVLRVDEDRSLSF